MTFVIGSRGSELALWQSHHVAEQLRTAHGPDFEIEVRVFSTRGDEVLDRSLPSIGGKGVFTAELEDALLRGEIGAAVHSLKDLPTELPEGLDVLAVPRRADPRDTLVLPDGGGRVDELATGEPLACLPTGARVGTSSLRRAAQLLSCRQDLCPVDIRGNVPTRLAKLDRGDYDAILLASAGLDRLGRGDRASVRLDPPWLGAAAQGALGVEGRKGDAAAAALLAPLEDRTARLETEAERAVLAGLQGGCSVPLGVWGRATGSQLSLQAVVLDPQGETELRVDGECAMDLQSARRLGVRLAEQLLERGAADLIGASNL